MKKVDGLNLISYSILSQIFLEVIDGVVLSKPHLFNKGNNKHIIKQFINTQDKFIKPLFDNLFDTNNDKTSDTNRNIDNLLSFVIIKNNDFNRKYLKIYQSTLNNNVPKTEEFIITNEDSIIYDKYILLSKLLLNYHDTYISGTIYKNHTLKNQLIIIDKLFEKHFKLKYTNNSYINFNNFMIDSNINQQLLFYENLLNHLIIESNC